MIDSIGIKFTRIAIVMLFAGVFVSVEAAQSNKADAAKDPPATSDPAPWLLASREGGCAPLSILARKGPDFSNIQTPYQLVEILRAKDHKTEIKEYKAGTRSAVEVNAPSAGLAVMFVKKEFCDKFLAGPERKK